MHTITELAAQCCGTLIDRHELQKQVQDLVDENAALKLQVAMLKRGMAKAEKTDRFGRVESVDVDWSKRPDIIGPNGNDGDHYEWR